MVGVVGLVISSLAHASSVADWFFNASTVCLVVGPFIFFVYVIIGLCVEFVSINQKPDIRTVARSPSLEVPLGCVGAHEWIPEGLLRERKGPLNPSTGRG